MSCCGTTYWCVDGVPTPGVTDEDTGVVSPPEGATGRPYATFAEASEACPLTITCPDCETPYAIHAGGVGVYTSGLGDVDPPGSWDLPGYTFIPLVSGTGATSFYYLLDIDVTASAGTQVQLAFYSGVCQPGGGMLLSFAVVLNYIPGSYGGQEVVDVAAGWSGLGTSGFSKEVACEEEVMYDTPTYIGRIAVDDSFVNYEFDVYLGPPL